MYPSEKLSNETPYPFTPATPDADLPAVAGILDAYLVIAGTPAAISPAAPATVTLISAVISGANIVYTFRADYALQRFTNTITVPRSGGILQVTTATYPLITLLVDTERLPTSSAGAIAAVVEPSRVIWDHEVVSSITVKNISRTAGVEDPDTLLTVYAYNPGAGNPAVVTLIDGYNTQWQVQGDELLLTTDAELGLGASPNYGDTVDIPTPDTRPILQCLNGLLPVGGDIPLEVSDSLGLLTGDGTLTVTRRA
jgi:hypothetical protein